MQALPGAGRPDDHDRVLHARPHAGALGSAEPVAHVRRLRVAQTGAQISRAAQQRLVRRSGGDLVPGGDPGHATRIGFDPVGVAAQPQPRPQPAGHEAGEQQPGDDPVDDRVQAVRVERRAGIAGAEQHSDPGGGIAGRLRCAGQERGHRPSGAQDQRDAEQDDQPDHGGVGQLVPERAGLSALLVHGRRRMIVVPETRPNRMTSMTPPAWSAPTPAGSMRARAVPVWAASVCPVTMATATSSPGTNPSPSTVWNTGPVGAFGSGSGSERERRRRAAMMSVKVVPSASRTSTLALHARVARATARPAGSGRTRKPPRLIVGLIPHAGGQMTEDMRQALDERRELIEARADAVLRGALADEEPWTADLGTAPRGEKQQAAWWRAARTVAAYRDRYGITDDRTPLGPTPESTSQKIDAIRARAALNRAQAATIEGTTTEPARQAAAARPAPSL